MEYRKTKEYEAQESYSITLRGLDLPALVDSQLNGSAASHIGRDQVLHMLRDSLQPQDDRQ